MDLKKKKLNNNELLETAAQILPTLMLGINIHSVNDQEKAIDLSVQLAQKLINKCK